VATAVSAAAAEAEHRAAVEAARAERQAAKEAARAAAVEAAARVAESAALARAAREQGSGAEPGQSGGQSAGATTGVPRPGRTPRSSDVWAAATADAGVGVVPRPPTVDHVVPGAAAPEDRGGSPGDDARAGDAV
jgi:hypothetical protein